MNKKITKEILTEGLKNTGISRGDIIYVHSSMKSIGWLENGADTLIEAFLEVLGDDGTLAVPSHTYSFADRGGAPFEPDKTPPQVGMFPDAVWRRPLAKRSGHASHSSAAIGAKAEYLTENHDLLDAVGYDSPIYKTVRSGGKILLIGVTHTANTAVHLAEALAAPYTSIPWDKSLDMYVHAKLPGGSVSRYAQTQYPGCSDNFDIIEEPLLEKQVMKFGRLGSAGCRLIDAAGMIETVTAMLKAQPDILMCRNPGCPCCPHRRALIN